MDYSTAVKNLWRHYDLSSDTPDYLILVKYATLAASSHNTQPWKFVLEPSRITILPDLSRRCPAVDPDDHHLYTSLGCAAENLSLAAQAAGLKGHYSYDPSASSVQMAFDNARPLRSTLFEAIPNRQSCRAEYDGSALSSKELRMLQDAGRGNGVSVMFFYRQQEKRAGSRVCRRWKYSPVR